MVINNDEYLFVEFEKFCKTCKHKGKKESEQPCCECLDNPTNLNSHKPVRYEEK